MTYVMIAEYYSIALSICVIHLLAIATIAKYLFICENCLSRFKIYCYNFINFLLKISFWYISVIENDNNPLVCSICYPMVFDIHCLCCHFDFSLVITNEYQIPGLLSICCAACSWVGPSGCNSYSIYTLECLCEIL